MAATGANSTNMVIGVAGKYCAGKNTLAAYLEKSGFLIIDVDAVGHSVVKDHSADIAQTFGAHILGPDGDVNRRILGKIVFRNPAKLRELEALTHPLMVAKIESMLGTTKKQKKQQLVAINAAILFKMGLQRLCDLVICVSAPFFVRLVRALARDSISLLEVLRRLLSQRGICLKLNAEAVDIYFVRNFGNQKKMKKNVQKILGAKGI